MIPRKLARRLLDEFLEQIEAAESAEDVPLDADGLVRVRDGVLEASDLVLRGAENAEQKARRYLTEGRIVVERVDGDGTLVVATCRGEEGTYKLGRDPRNGEWRCTCPAPRNRCSHLIALRLVVRPS